MKKLLFILLVLVAMLLSSCSEKDDNPTDVNIYGYKLEQFIPKTAVHDLITTDENDLTDYRNLFSYEIVSADANAWSPRLSSYAGYDLSWANFKEGFYVPSDEKKTWFANPALPGAFKVRNAGTFKLYRKVDVVGGRSTKEVELRGLQLSCIINWSGTNEEAIKLSDLLQGLSSYSSVTLIATDGFSRTYTPEQIADGCYLLNSEVTTFPSFNTTTPTSGQWKLKKLARVNVTTAEIQMFPFRNADHEYANISFSIPADLSGYTKTLMTNH
jgi:hypothetical protein